MIRAVCMRKFLLDEWDLRTNQPQHWRKEQLMISTILVLPLPSGWAR